MTCVCEEGSVGACTEATVLAWMGVCHLLTLVEVLQRLVDLTGALCMRGKHEMDMSVDDMLVHKNSHIRTSDMSERDVSTIIIALCHVHHIASMSRVSHHTCYEGYADVRVCMHDMLRWICRSECR